jgi:hypothetical protein
VHKHIEYSISAGYQTQDDARMRTVLAREVVAQVDIKALPQMHITKKLMKFADVKISNTFSGPSRQHTPRMLAACTLRTSVGEVWQQINAVRCSNQRLLRAADS